MASQRLYRSVAEQITDLIELGVFRPGARLPSERALAEEFEVSRVTVREALVSLQTLGRVHIRTGSGVYVRSDVSAEAPRQSEARAFELTQARLLIESEAAALAAPEVSDETLEQLQKLLARMAASASDAEADEADRDFHLAIAAASGNRILRQVIESLWRLRLEQEDIKSVYQAVCSQDTVERGQEHAEILDALRGRNADAARLAMRKHFRRLMESMLEVTEEQALEQVKKDVAKARQRYLQGAHW